MTDLTPIPLTPILIELDSPEFQTISDWQFEDSFVGRLLRDDIPQRVQFNDCKLWVYHDPDSRVVGFGTIDVCKDYSEYVDRRPHPYIPLLAKNPTLKSLGYGTSIVRHLIGEAVLLVHRYTPGMCSDVLFLDVYTSSERAIRLYHNSGFVKLTDEPLQDPDHGGKPYIVMAKRVSVAKSNASTLT